MMTSLYHSLKSLARGVIFWAWPLLEDTLPDFRQRHLALLPRLQVPHHGDLRLALVRPDDNGTGGPARRRQLQLLADRLIAERILDRDAAVPQAGRERQHGSDVLASDRNQEGVELARRLGVVSSLPHELAVPAISHPYTHSGPYLRGALLCLYVV